MFNGHIHNINKMRNIESGILESGTFDVDVDIDEDFNFEFESSSKLPRP